MEGEDCDYKEGLLNLLLPDGTFAKRYFTVFERRFTYAFRGRETKHEIQVTTEISYLDESDMLPYGLCVQSPGQPKLQVFAASEADMEEWVSALKLEAAMIADEVIYRAKELAGTDGFDPSSAAVGISDGSYEGWAIMVRRDEDGNYQTQATYLSLNNGIFAVTKPNSGRLVFNPPRLCSVHPSLAAPSISLTPEVSIILNSSSERANWLTALNTVANSLPPSPSSHGEGSDYASVFATTTQRPVSEHEALVINGRGAIFGTFGRDSCTLPYPGGGWSGARDNDNYVHVDSYEVRGSRSTSGSSIPTSDTISRHGSFRSNRDWDDTIVAHVPRTSSQNSSSQDNYQAAMGAASSALEASESHSNAGTVRDVPFISRRQGSMTSIVDGTLFGNPEWESTIVPKDLGVRRNTNTSKLVSVYADTVVASDYGAALSALQGQISSKPANENESNSKDHPSVAFDKDTKPEEEKSHKNQNEYIAPQPRVIKRQNSNSLYSARGIVRQSTVRDFVRRQSKKSLMGDESERPSIEEGPIKVYGNFHGTVGYKTLIVSSEACASEVVTAVLKKFRKDDFNSAEYCLSEVDEKGKDRELDANESPLAVKRNWSGSKRFYLRRKIEGPHDGAAFPILHVHLPDGATTALRYAETLVSSRVIELALAKSGVGEEGRNVFSLWAIDAGLELQIEPFGVLKSIFEEWPEHVRKYRPSSLSNAVMALIATGSTGPLMNTIKTEEENILQVREPGLYLRRWAFLSKTSERKVKDPATIRLLYEEAVHNVVRGKYPLSINESFHLAGIQAQLAYGDHNDSVHFINILERFLPEHLIANNKAVDLERRIIKAHKEHTGRDPLILRLLYLQYLRQHLFYGATFFPGRVRTGIGASNVHKSDEGLNVPINSVVLQTSNEDIRAAAANVPTDSIESSPVFSKRGANLGSATTLNSMSSNSDLKEKDKEKEKEEKKEKNGRGHSRTISGSQKHLLSQEVKPKPEEPFGSMRKFNPRMSLRKSNKHLSPEEEEKIVRVGLSMDGVVIIDEDRCSLIRSIPFDDVRAFDAKADEFTLEFDLKGSREVMIITSPQAELMDSFLSGVTERMLEEDRVLRRRRSFQQKVQTIG